jgi:hypothetical protein
LQSAQVSYKQGGLVMKKRGLLLGCVLSMSICANAAPLKLQSVYSKITEGPDCAYEQSATEESDIKYDCPGPVAGVRTLLHRGGDYDHLAVFIDGQQFSLWEPMVSVGAWAGIGNKKGVVEWLFIGRKPLSRSTLKALIVRFEGTRVNADGEAAGTRSELAVFELNAGKLCWKGNFADNAAARRAVLNADCKAPLNPAEPDSAG